MAHSHHTEYRDGGDEGDGTNQELEGEQGGAPRPFALAAARQRKLGRTLTAFYWTLTTLYLDLRRINIYIRSDNNTGMHLQIFSHNMQAATQARKIIFNSQFGLVSIYMATL